jgi:hypothetical protein
LGRSPAAQNTTRLTPAAPPPHHKKPAAHSVNGFALATAIYTAANISGGEFLPPFQRVVLRPIKKNKCRTTHSQLSILAQKQMQVT